MKTLFSCFLFLLALSLKAQNPSANFTATPMGGCSPLVVAFTDASTGNPTAWQWDFGNGATSTLRNPSTTYFTPGNYTVRLTVTNASGNHTLTRTGLITVYAKPAVAFGADDSTGCFPHTARFRDLTTPAPGTTNVAWLWDFGDGTQSTEQNPVHTYTTAGNFTVTLRVTSDRGCYGVAQVPNFIRLSGALNADFTQSVPTVCRPPAAINFTNRSTGEGTLSYLWTFGDGSTDNVANPTKVYNRAGTYTVSLRVSSTNGCVDTTIRTGAVVIDSIASSFSVTDTICADALVRFRNTSNPTPVSSRWLFGDGTTSDSLHPVKRFAAAGTYTVTLINTFAGCSDTIRRTVRVQNRPVARFTAQDTTACRAPLRVTFRDNSTGAVRWLWDFGDSTTSTDQHPVHLYTREGIYDVRLIVFNAAGCSDTAEIEELVKIVRPIVDVPALPLRGCIPYTAVLEPAIYSVDSVVSYLWVLGDGTTYTTPTVSHLFTVPGSYSVRLTITTRTGCSTTFEFPGGVTVGERPVVRFSVQPPQSCAQQPVQFTNESDRGDTWEWDFGDGGRSPERDPRYSYSDTGTFDVKLVVFNSGCADSLTLQRIVRILPPVADFGYTTDCSDRRLFNFSDSSIGATSWRWDFGDGNISTDQNPTYRFPDFGTYQVRLTVTNDTCSSTLVQNVSVLDLRPDFSAPVTSACKVATITPLTAVSSNNPDIVLYNWDFGNGTGAESTSNQAGVTYYTSGRFTVRLITTDIYGCRDTVTKPDYITISGPTARFDMTDYRGCTGITTSFTDQSVSDGIHPIVNWRWNFGDGSVQNLRESRNLTHTYGRPGFFSPQLVVTDSNGCSDSLLLRDYVVTTSPVADFYSTDSLSCPGGPVPFFNTSTGLNENFLSFWSFGDGGTSTERSPTYSYRDTGRYTVTLVVQDPYGCRDTLERPRFARSAFPTAAFEMSDSISSCTPFEVAFTNTSDYFVSSVWDLGGGISTLNNPIQFYTQPGVYPIQLVVRGPGGCMDTAYGRVQVFDTVGTRLRYTPLDGCKPLRIELDADSPGPVTYTWDFGDGVLETTESETTTHVYNTYGTFRPKIILTDQAGCIFAVEGPDTLIVRGANAKFGADRNLLCDLGPVQFLDSTTFNDPIQNYLWDFGDGSTSTEQNPLHQYTGPGNYPVTLIIRTQAYQCTDTFRLRTPVKVVQSPMIRIAGDSVVCVGGSMQHLGLFERSDTSAVRWSWVFPNGNGSTLEDPVRQRYNTAGTFQVSAIAINSSGCADTAARPILVNPLPVIDVPSSVTMQVGFPITIPATYSPNVATWQWAPPTGLSCTDCPSPVAGPKFTTDYVVSVTDSNGCRNSAPVQVVVLCENANVFLPNTFSPNADGSNDRFYIRGRGLERVKSLRIFNRWGEVVYEATNVPVNNPQSGWDGRYKGKPATADVYVYQVEVFCENSQIIRFEGNVALIR